MSGSDPPSSPSTHGSFALPSQFNYLADSRPPTPVRVLPVNEIFERRTVRKIDRRLLPVLGVLYALAFIDTTNFIVARQQGAGRDLNLFFKDRYLLATGIFFVPYTLFQLPLNLALRRVGPSTWIGTLTFLVGAALIWLAFVNNWQQFVAVRAILGLLEAIFLPSSVYLISCWYTRRELHIRLAYFYATSIFLGSFANILAFGFSRIHSSSTMGWRWIFIIQGIITMLLTPYGYINVLPFPDKSSEAHAPFLTRDEVHLMRQRVEVDRRDYAPDSLTGAKFRAYLSDFKLWAFAMLAMCATTPIHIVIHLPSDVPSLVQYLPATFPVRNFRSASAQLLFIPPGLFACLLTIVTAKLSDRLNLRGPFIAFNFLLSIVGVCMVAFSDRRGVRYAGGFLAYGGAQANVPSIFTYQANNIRLHSKRIYTISLVTGFAGAGGLVATFTFPLSALPAYRTGLWVVLALQLTGFVVVVLLMGAFWRANTKAGRRPTATPTPTIRTEAAPPPDLGTRDDGSSQPAQLPTPASAPTSPVAGSSGTRQLHTRMRQGTIEGWDEFTYTI